MIPFSLSVMLNVPAECSKLLGAVKAASGQNFKNKDGGKTECRVYLFGELWRFVSKQ